MKKYALILAAAATIYASAAETSITNRVGKDRRVTITAITDNIIRVDNVAAGEQPNAAIVTDLTTPNATCTAFDRGQYYGFTTATGVRVNVNRNDGSFSVGRSPETTVFDYGPRRITSRGQEFSLYLDRNSKASLYGAGERGHKLNLAGDTLVMYNRQNYGYTAGDPRISQMNITMPLILSSDGFAVVFDDYAAAKLIAGQNQLDYISESPLPVSYYYINGASTLADVTTELTALTGRQPLPPLWSLGYITSKYGYHNQAETVGVVDTLQQQGYPLDGIVLDLYWYGKEQDMGRLEWDPKQWPDPEGMLKELKDRNVNLVAISQPYVLRNGRGNANYKELAPKGMFVADATGKKPQNVVIWVGQGGMFDVSNPDTRRWLSDRYRKLTDMGVTGWWGDLGEPEVHPETGLHHNGLTARLYHNRYGNDWSQIISDLFAEQYPDRRLLTMMRGGTIGLQRYSVFPWSTDVSRSWGGLQPQVTIMLNSGLSGLGYMGHDVGGFAIDPANPVDAELYVRWLQLGLFSPMLRTHAQYNAEPYHYPEYEAIIKQIIRDRYLWLPYNYTLAYENATKGWPLVRPLNFTEPQTTRYDSITDEFLWGSDVLVAPVMYPGWTERSVTFPEGSWVDYNDPTKTYAGGTTATVSAPLSQIPLFVRAGSFIPAAEYTMKSTADYDPSHITINYFVSKAETEYTLYDDDRTSPSAIADGQYRLIHFKSDGREITITSEGEYPAAPTMLRFTFRIIRGADVRYIEIQYIPGSTNHFRF